MAFNKNKVLITGGCGYIGSHTAVNLLKAGFNVVLLDSNINSSPNVVKNISKIAFEKESIPHKRLSFYKGDIRDVVFLNNLFEKENETGQKISFVIHFAGLKSVRDSSLSPLEYWDSNVIGSLKLLEMMKKYNCKNIIFSSSATVYNSKSNNKISENDTINPINPYGNTKITIEKILKDIFKSDPNNWRIACLRYFNPIGAHPSGYLGENPLGTPNNIFPLIMNVALGQASNLEVYGNDWDTPDGTCIRDYIHVMDVSEGHIKTLEYLLKNDCQFISLNIGTGKGTSVLELINTFKKVNKVDIPYKFSDRRKGDLMKVVADNSLSLSILKWKPILTIQEMCKDGWKWKILNPKGYC